MLQAERAVSSVIFSTGGGDALLAAAAAAREGKRAAAVLAPHELLAAIGALHTVARARAPIVVHVVAAPSTSGPARRRPCPPGPCPGRDELAPALDAGAGVLVAWSTQETVDLTLAARRAAEDAETPFLLVTDGAGPVMALPGPGLVAGFLGTTGREGSFAPAPRLTPLGASAPNGASPPASPSPSPAPCGSWAS